ncbi:MAG: hypothetical protein LBR23_09490, partial [Spirochaetaceae bacterium]|nr:hypothetical protein [Spirochaetaceae bacterium]
MKRAGWTRIVLGVIVGVFALSGGIAQETGGSSQATVTIVNARSTSYSKDPITGGNAITFSGNVELTIESGGSVTTIKSEDVRYNRENQLLYATGNISLTQKKKDGSTEEMTASSILLNTDTLEGIFDGARIVSLGNISGKSSAAAATGSSSLSNPTLVVAADLFGRDEKGTIAFQNGSLTFCDDEENPHWKINASRIWLLPGNEFAFFNALLYVGKIPLFYLPFFYYPKDEVVFNPVVGTDDDRGYFIQTTTYIIGRKQAEAGQDDLEMFSFLKPSGNKKQKLEGLILRNLDEDAGTVSGSYLKLMADYYSNLGLMVGLDGKFHPHQNISKLDASFYMGYSYSHPENEQTIYDIQGETHSVESNFLGFQVPFRYKANVDISITKPFSLSLTMPLYSDTEFEKDFLDRKETLDWLGDLIKTGLAKDEDDETTTGDVSSFSWNLNSSYSAPVKFSWLSTLSLNYTAQLGFYGYANPEYETQKSFKNFYTPRSTTPAHAVLSFSGTIFEYPRAAAQAKEDATKTTPPPGLVPPERLKKKDEKSAETAAAETSQVTAPQEIAEGEAPPEEEGEAAAEESPQEDPLLNPQTLPRIPFSSAAVSRPGGFTYKLGYTVSADFTNEMIFLTNPVKPEDFDWGKVYSSMISVKSPITMNSSAGWRDSFIGITSTVNFSPVFQKHPILLEDSTLTSDDPSKGHTKSSIESIINNDYGAQKLDTTMTNAVTLRPFVYNSLLSGTNLSWNTGLNLVRTEYIGTYDNPEWEYHPPKWDDESITAHTLNFTFAAKEGDFSQSLTLSSNLPPRVDRYTYSMNLGVPYVTLTASNGVQKVSKDSDEWKFDSLAQSMTVKLFESKLNITQSYNYSIEKETPESLSLSASGYG